MLRVTFCLNKYDCSCVLNVYRPGQPNLHNWCELESETLLGVTRGELLVIWGSVTLKKKILFLSLYLSVSLSPLTLQLTHLSFFVFLCMQTD